MDYMISIDWFQVTCKRCLNDRIFEGMYFEGTLENDKRQLNMYHIEAPQEFNAMFADCYSVKIHNYPVATIYATPRPSTLEPTLCMLKLANALLYTPKWIWYLYDVLTGLRWKFHNITRVDLCCDFNTFANDLSPREFIKRYLSSGKSDDGEERYWRVGGNKFYTIGTRRQTEGGTGVESACDYLRFGSRTSGVATYLYNKTQELDDKGGKKYIRELWHKIGFTDTPDAPVFRLEMSITPSAMKVKRKLTPDEEAEQKKATDIIDQTLKHWQVRTLAMNDFETEAKITNLFWCYASHYFHFKQVGTQKMPHNWKDVELFNVELDYQMKPYLAHADKKSGVAESNAAKRITALLDNEQFTISDKLAMYRTAEILSALADKRMTTINPDAIVEATEMLIDGCDFHTLEETAPIPKSHINLLHSYVKQCIARDLECLYNMPEVVDAVARYDYETEQARDAAQYAPVTFLDDGEPLTLQPCLEDYEREIERRNKDIHDRFLQKNL